MSFLSLILKNPFRNRARAALAIIGIGIGIATIVALGAITSGLTSSLDDTLHEGGADFTVLNKEEDSLGTPYGTKTLNESWVDTIRKFPGVKKVESIYLASVTADDEFSTVIGVNYNDSFDPKSMDLTMINGSLIKKNNEVIIGKLTAKDLEKTVNDTVSINDENFKIVGIFESGDPSQDGIIAPIEDMQRISEDEGHVSMLYVFADKGVDIKKLSDDIEKKYSENLTAITSISDIETVSDALGMVDTASWGISLLAIVIGGIGIINTMIMSVYERTREIGVLKAVGWKSRRILTMILGESLVLTITSAIIGSIVGVAFIEIARLFDIFAGMTPIFTLNPFLQGFAVAIIVGLIGGFYPAYRASKLPPTEALRYE
ncbi:MAG: ABC transporter permease [Methanobrevibacter sp.]|jgi:putative ABC transport system permease protein|nr:ABC transporter permease [Candidatus Methanoflexus mossambicus]